jgi:hypothetical protein
VAPEVGIACPLDTEIKVYNQLEILLNFASAGFTSQGNSAR